MIAFIKYIRGYLRIKVTGISPERFINLCGNKGILLWDVTKDKEDVYYMCIHVSNFWQLRPIVRKTGTKVAVIERCGLPFFMPKLLQRKAFILGLLAAVLFWMYSSTFVWQIQVEGNERITEDLMFRLLTSEGVKVGCKKNAVDIETLEKVIRNEFSIVTWASAKFDGTRLLISIKENDAPIIVEMAGEAKGMDLIAEYDGRIISMIVRKGVPQVSIGDEVIAGEVLVDGKVPVFNEDGTVREYQYVDASADIILEHAVECNYSMPYDYIKQIYTGRVYESKYLRIGKITLGGREKPPYLLYDNVQKEGRYHIFEKLSIPIYLGTNSYREYQNLECEYSLEEAERLLNEKIANFATSLGEKGVHIIENNVTIGTTIDSWTVKGDFLVQEPVKKTVSTHINEEENGTELLDE